MRHIIVHLVALATLISALPALAGTPVEDHGALAVSGNRIVDAHNTPVRFSGVSLFWSNAEWGQAKFYKPETVAYFAKDWNASLVRAAIGVEPNGGYLNKPDDNRKRAETVVEAAVVSGIYVIIDWHAHKAHEHPDAAVAFFTEMARKYGHLPNVIYEIYNEPLDTADWRRDVKPYAQRVIDAIRAHDPDNLILVGSPRWSQDVDIATADPVKGTNIAYVLHFYAGTHGQFLRDKADVALGRGFALFVSEWGSVNANGDGPVAVDETQRWQAYMAKNCLSQANWSVSDFGEGSSMFKKGTPLEGPWSDADLSPSGLNAKSYVKAAKTTCE